MKSAIVETNWLDHFRDSMLAAENFRACLTLGASWLCEWIDMELASQRLKPLDVGGYTRFCFAQADEMESWRGEDEELWVWAWNAAGEMFKLYEEMGAMTDEELVAQVCIQMDETDMGDKHGYARHLCLCAVSYVHGWVHAESL